MSNNEAVADAVVPRPGILSRAAPTSALLVLLAVPGARAQEEPTPEVRDQEQSIDSPFRWIERGLRVGLSAGYVDAGRGNLRFGPGSTATLGARLRARISSPLSIELGATYGGAERFVVDPRLETGPAAVDTVASGWVTGDVALQVALTGARTWHGLHPYVLFGGGLMIGVDEEGSDVFADSALADFRYDLGTAPLFQGGVGVELRPSDRIGVGLEVRDFLLRLKAPDGFFRREVLDIIEEIGAEAPAESQWPGNLMLNVTLWYYF